MSQAVCVGEVVNTAAKGLTLSPARYAYTSRGQTGSINCTGSVNGHAVTGPGTISDDGVIEGNCAQGSASGSVVMIIPTEAGRVTLRIPVSATYVGTVGVREGGEFPGPFVFYPTQGDCVLTPVTEAAVAFHGVLLT